MQRIMSRALPALAGVLTLVFGQAGLAGPVTLTSEDGTINVSGDLIAFENDTYIVKSDLGNLTIDANRVKCEGTGCPTKDFSAADLRFGGSDAFGSGLMPLLIKGYATSIGAEAIIGNGPNDTDPHAVIVADLIEDQGFGDPIGGLFITPTISDDAFRKMLAKNIDVGLSARRISPDEARALRKAGAGVMVDPAQEHIVAADALVMIVNPANPVNEISIADIARIYSGEVANWAELGGPDVPITVVTRPDSASTQSVFNQRIFQGEGKGAPVALIEAKTNRAAADAVNEVPGAIGYVGQAFARGAKVLPIVSECGILEEPDVFAAKTGEYAIVEPLYMYTPEGLDRDLATQLIAYTGSDAADQVIAQAGFVDFGIATRDQGPESARVKALANAGDGAFEKSIVADLLANMTGSERLSTTFRFKIGSTALDPRGQIDMDRLVKALAGMPQGTQVMLVGFSDTDGEFEPNIGVSKKRAEIVADALIAAGGDQLGNVEVKTLGYGEIAPVACNNSTSQRETNRRVEVWVKKP